MYPNGAVEPMTAAATVTTRRKVTLGRGGLACSRSGYCMEGEEKGKVLSYSSGLGCFMLPSLKLLSSCTRGRSGWLTFSFIRKTGSSMQLKRVQVGCRLHSDLLVAALFSYQQNGKEPKVDQVQRAHAACLDHKEPADPHGL